MTSNFSFLENNSEFNTFSTACLEAEKSITTSPATCAILTRRALELAVKWIYTSDGYLEVPYQDNLSSLIHDRTFKDIIEPNLFPLITYIVKLGNIAAHTNNKISRQEAILTLKNLHQFVSWMDYCYSPKFTADQFDESILNFEQEEKVSHKELKDLFDSLGEKDKKLQDVVSENEKLREEIQKIRENKIHEQKFNVDQISEFETRKHYIDIDLKEIEWVFGEDCIEEYEVSGMPFGSGKGFVDYVLFGNNGKPLAVIEAKKTSKDPKIGKQQAKLYADCLENKFGQRPVIFYTNGFEIYLWDDSSYPARRVSGYYNKEELNLMIDRRTTRISLDKININDNISDRYYQKEAIKSVCESFKSGDRKALLVMATGSGKTRTAASLVDVLARHEWVKNVLFLADRTALVKQAKNSFNNNLPNLSLCNLLDSKDNPESRIVFSTYPTLMNAIDDTKSRDGKKLFTVGHFDLIIIDESHRSIYKKYQAIFDYFDALLVGLTATPKSDIDKNTYQIFDLENNVPTYAYELEQAVKDKYLVNHYDIEAELKFLEEGIFYDQLSEDEKEAYEETFDEENMPEFIPNEALNSWLFNDDTIDKAISLLMEKGIKIEGGDKLGKTIIFAKNHNHAEKIVERFDKLYPHYSGSFARVIDNYVNYAESLLDDFSDKNKMPQIAVSVDMLDTGIDIHEIVNLMFFKKVKSKAKFWQMIGRGTRLCENLFGPAMDKEYFYIFDLCGNFEFFKEHKNGKEVKTVQTLTEKLFNVKAELAKQLQHLDYQEDKYTSLRNDIVNNLINDVKRLNKESFVIKQQLRFVDKYNNDDTWKSINDGHLMELKEHIAHLIIPHEDDELARRFDYLMYTLGLAKMLGKTIENGKVEVKKIAEELAKLGTIPQIVAKKDIISLVRKEEFWDIATVLEYETVRKGIRDLVKFIEKPSGKIYETNFTDQLIIANEAFGEYHVSVSNDYKKKVNTYIREHENNLAIYKLKHNKPLSKQDFMELEKILLNELGTKEDYKKEFGDTPLTLLVRQIIGLDQAAANEAFSEFLNTENLDSKQIRFVKIIVDYVVRNGVIDKSELQEEPFKSVGSITEIFTMEKAIKLIKVIDGINKNATDVGA